MNARMACIDTLLVIVERCTNCYCVAISAERDRGSGSIVNRFAVDVVAPLYPCRIGTVVIVDSDGS